MKWWADAFGWALVLAWLVLVAMIFWVLVIVIPPSAPINYPTSTLPR